MPGKGPAPTGPSQVPAFSNLEIRALADRGRVNSRAGWKSRTAGGAAGGIAGGLLGNYLYDQAKGLLQ